MSVLLPIFAVVLVLVSVCCVGVFGYLARVVWWKEDVAQSERVPESS